MKHINIIGMILASLALVTSCDDKEYGEPMEEANLISEIKLDVTPMLPLAIGTDSVIVHHITPENPTNPVLKWISSDESVATVSADGRVTAKAIGKAVVTAMPEIGFAASGTNGVVEVQVIAEVIKIQNITFVNQEPSLYVGEQMEMGVNIAPANHTYSSLKWSSDNESVLTVTDKGIVTAHTKGTATITASALDKSGVKQTVKVTVKETVIIDNVELVQPSEELAIGELYSLSYVLTPADATAVTLKWSSNNTSVATVEKGLLKAVGVGTAVITATAPATGKSSEVKVTVAAGALKYSFASAIEPWSLKSSQGASVSFDGEKMTVKMKEQAKYRADLVLTENGSKGMVTLTAGIYRYFAIKMLRPTAGNFILDTNNGRYKQYVGNGNNQYTVLGTETAGKPGVYYYDLQAGFGNDGGQPKYLLPTNMPGELKTFQLVVADIPNDKWGNTYDVYWMRTFKTLDDLKAFVEQDNNN